MCKLDIERGCVRITLLLLVLVNSGPMSLGADGPVLEVKGYLMPASQIAITPKVGGQIVELMIEEGKQVKAGEVLARLDSEEYKAAHELAFARLLLAEAGFAKAKEGNGKADLAIAEAKIKVAHAGVVIARYHLDCTVVRAPCNGTVLMKRAEVGSRIDPKASQVPASLCELADLRMMEVEVWVQERDLAKVTKGQACLIRVEAFPKTVYRGRVARLAPVSDRAREPLAVRVRIELPEGDERLRPELGAIVQFLEK